MNAQTTAAYRPGRYAAIDIGTVTARLLVADVDADGEITELHRDQAICNLGIGVDKTGRLAEEAIDRVVQVVGRFMQTLGELQPADGPRICLTANATSASRDAENSSDFVDALDALGVQLAVIPGSKEAALSFAGASSAFPGQRVIVLDVGGGSSEIIAGQAGGAPRHAHSFNIGCRRVTERYFHDDPPTAQQIQDAGAWIAQTMHDYLEGLSADGFGDCRIVAVAGTATSVISMREQMEVYDSSRVHGAVATRADIDELLRRLSGMTLAERQQVVGLDPARAPVIVAGVLILQQILQTLKADSFTTSERDILHGIILDAAQG
ncbi:MAG TPA: exopolyphosphatase [Eggerthellaceae bacterium]|nr:exopolyphosphatase [Eggerthellaceae bacterium]